MAEDLTRWEYKRWIPDANDITNKNDRELAKLGQEGWEMVGGSPLPGVTFKRPMRPNQPQRNIPPYNPPQR